MLFSSYPNTVIDDYSIDPSCIARGVIFLYAAWSPTIVQLRCLITSLEGTYNFPLYIFDIDVANSNGFLEHHGMCSDGWGETYWVKDGKSVATMKKYTSIDNKLLAVYNDLLT